MAEGQPDNLPLLVDIAFELLQPFGEVREPPERLTVSGALALSCTSPSREQFGLIAKSLPFIGSFGMYSCIEECRAHTSSWPRNRRGKVRKTPLNCCGRSHGIVCTSGARHAGYP